MGIGEAIREANDGPVVAALVCPHCGTPGRVRAKAAKEKRGVSGAKATGALLTGGVSILVTGLSRKQRVTVCRCGHCGTGWTIA